MNICELCNEFFLFFCQANVALRKISINVNIVK